MVLKIETGRIIKSLSGFYDVQTDKKVITCRARGHMRRAGMSPLVGDVVDISVEKGKEARWHVPSPRQQADPPP